MYIQALLDKGIANNVSWARVDGGFTATPMDASDTRHQVVFISDAELFAIHPLLPSGLRLSIEDGPVLSNFDIGTMVRVWQSQTIVKLQYSKPVVFFDVESVDVCSEDVYINGSAQRIQSKMDSETGEIIYLPMGHSSQVSMFIMWMDEAYPGWKKRYAIANDIGLSPELIVQSMLDQEKAYQVSFPSVDLAV